MKKILSLSLAVCATACMAFSFTSCEELPIHFHVYETEWSTNETHHWHACKTEACNQVSDKGKHIYVKTTDAYGNPVQICETCSHTAIIVPEHEHVFDTEWSSNKDCHWKACKTLGCTERKEQADHYFRQESTHGADYIETVYTCDVCEYTYTDRMTVNTIVPDEKTWIDAFNELDYTNYTVSAKWENNSGSQHNKVEISETAAHYVLGGYFYNSPVGINEYYTEYEFYTIKQKNGTYNTYERRDNAERFTLLDDKTDYWYKSARMESLIALKYDEHYDEFVYNEEQGTYFCSNIIETTYCPNPNYPDKKYSLYCKNVEVKAADGAIIYVASDYADFEAEEEGTIPSEEYFTSKLLYDNIGLTVVTLPAGAAENALPDDGSYHQ